MHIIVYRERDSLLIAITTPAKQNRRQLPKSETCGEFDFAKTTQYTTATMSLCALVRVMWPV